MKRVSKTFPTLAITALTTLYVGHAAATTNHFTQEQAFSASPVFKQSRDSREERYQHLSNTIDLVQDPLTNSAFKYSKDSREFRYHAVIKEDTNSEEKTVYPIFEFSRDAREFQYQR